MFIEPVDKQSKLSKGVTGLTLFKNFPELENESWRRVLWSPSYYVGTAGHVAAEVIDNLVEYC